MSRKHLRCPCSRQNLILLWMAGKKSCIVYVLSLQRTHNVVDESYCGIHNLTDTFEYTNLHETYRDDLASILSSLRWLRGYKGDCMIV